MSAAVLGELKTSFRPEFLNRVDDIVVFRPLAKDEIRRIVDIQLRRVQALAEELDVHLELSDEAKDFLSAEGFDPAFGARPIKREIQRRVQDPLALYLLEEDLPAGTCIVASLDDRGEGLRFDPRPVVVPADALQRA